MQCWSIDRVVQHDMAFFNGETRYITKLIMKGKYKVKASKRYWFLLLFEQQRDNVRFEHCYFVEGQKKKCKKRNMAYFFGNLQYNSIDYRGFCVYTGTRDILCMHNGSVTVKSKNSIGKNYLSIHATVLKFWWCMMVLS